MINVLGEFILSVCAAQMSGKKLLRYKHEGLGKRRVQQIIFWELDSVNDFHRHHIRRGTKKQQTTVEIFMTRNYILKKTAESEKSINSVFACN